MAERAAPSTEVIDLAPGLWIWRLEHPAWHEDCDWQEVVTCVCVDAGEERWLLDPLLPPDQAIHVWDRLVERPPTAVALLTPDHNRPTYTQALDPSGRSRTSSLDTVVERFGCRAFGPDDWSDNTPPETQLKKIRPGEALPGGLMPFRDPRGWSETPLWLPEHRTLVVGDALTERSGALRVWMSPAHEERAIPDLRAMLDLPLQRVIISHGAPVHTREALERALERPPWPGTPLHIAAYGGNEERVRSLVDAGADVSARDDRYNGTPLDWAQSGRKEEWAAGRRHQQVIAYLESVMAARLRRSRRQRRAHTAHTTPGRVIRPTEQSGVIMPTRAEILDTLAASQTQVMAFFRGLSPEDLERPTTVNDVPGEAPWRPKDHLAHLANSERAMLQLLRRALAGETREVLLHLQYPEAMPMPGTLGDLNALTPEELDRLKMAVAGVNQACVDEHHDDSLEMLAADYLAVRQETSDLLHQFTDDQLAAPVPTVVGDEAAGDLFAGRAEHAAGHIAAVEEGLRRGCEVEDLRGG